MVLNTLTVGAAVTPTVIATSITHYLNRKPLHQKPTAHLSYHEGLNLVRRFIIHSAYHTVEELQAFTAQWVPVPHWVRVDTIEITQDYLTRAANHISEQLGPEGVELVGGKHWWQWRRQKSPLKAEWIEMRKDHAERKKTGDRGHRVILYIHGGAYYFGSNDEHRYQMQRHARKLKAKLLTPEYRLAPEFPFPCGLHDSLAAYLYLLEHHHPNEILLAGDSAGGGMCMALMLVLRDQGLPLPAGGMLLSPWVDLTHSFPSVAGDGAFDYIPSNGFVHRPSRAWPPPNSDDLESFAEEARKAEQARNHKKPQNPDEPEMPMISVAPPSGSTAPPVIPASLSETTKHYGPNLTINIDGKEIEIKDQIQLYAANHLLTYPLVSPVMAASLGGLPPLLIQTGGGELLCDEQVYLAHKAAHPTKYPPPKHVYASHPGRAAEIEAEMAKYPPTDVQLQVWDDLCHVAHTLSWTRPAKYMYRSVAQFGAWALARSQNRAIDILVDDSVSDISSGGSDTDSTADDSPLDKVQTDANLGYLPSFAPIAAGMAVGKAGDPLPPFADHMIRQRVDRHGDIRPLPPVDELPAMLMPVEQIGIIKEGPVRKWLDTQKKWSKLFGKERENVQATRLKEIREGYVGFSDLNGGLESPPPTALAGRRRLGKEEVGPKKPGRSWGMSMWSGWGMSHDKNTIRREKAAPKTPDIESVVPREAEASASPRETSRAATPSEKGRPGLASSPSRYRSVTDEGQAGTPLSGASTPSGVRSGRSSLAGGGAGGHTRGNSMIYSLPEEEGTGLVVPKSNSSSTRPTSDGIAFPFKLKVGDGEQNAEGRSLNASLLTLPGTPGLEQNAETGASEETGEEKNINGHENGNGKAIEPTSEADATNGEKRTVERPGVERFVTAPEF
ncbi:alpha/beta-hydrolase [Aulographum hederae CBS 113979]|uniref:Alpha/beta-hydrolase n=1 Tax=Aulographum hederae CBS 113979 TaxID=1176131 RepID=A0A6G1GL30_9PEZI|nr:alpha/beta-hydrolase [Aulographum hederae CBS 113979]